MKAPIPFVDSELAASMHDLIADVASTLNPLNIGEFPSDEWIAFALDLAAVRAHVLRDNVQFTRAEVSQLERAGDLQRRAGKVGAS